MPKRKPFSSVQELLLKTPLYEELAVDGRDAVVRTILTFDGAVDTYCPGCKQHATFRGLVTEETSRNTRLMSALSISSGSGRAPHPWAQRKIEKTLSCTRDRHRIECHFICETDYLVKVGQYPSMAEIEKGDTDKYEPVLGRERLKEFNRAIGLSAHGVGVGAHVYLRRIFEALVEEAHQVAIREEKNWDEAKYQQSRMAERIQLLKGYVPEFLSENPRLYGIMSKGIHELSEDECLANFEALKLSIEVILDQRLEERARQTKTGAARKALARIDGPGKQEA